MKHLKRLLMSMCALMACTMMCAQKLEANGTVVDQTGETVIGATVMEKGTTNGVISDIDGRFKIMVDKGATLVVSFIGFKNTEVAGGAGLTITLKEDASELNEVVVTG